MQNKKRAFTLIEMLVVIAIIGVLAGIITFVIAGARQKANATRAKADLTQLNNVMAIASAEGCNTLTVTNGSTNLKLSGTLPDGTTKEYATLSTPPSGFTYYINVDSNSATGCTGTPVAGEKYYSATGGANWTANGTPSTTITLSSNPTYCSKGSGFSASALYSCKNSGCFCSVSGGCAD